jgi:hypothetical protein
MLKQFPPVLASISVIENAIGSQPSPVESQRTVVVIPEQQRVVVPSPIIRTVFSEVRMMFSMIRSIICFTYYFDHIIK